ncbi:hypothetical protein, partial [Frigidibacter sp. MR17.24]|uniref:hypothetical protein n=1 Tax=Frigidibacter sp. MR17.24 TaxID=3127345 RepID=UPI003012E1D3
DVDLAIGGSGGGDLDPSDTDLALDLGPIDAEVPLDAAEVLIDDADLTLDVDGLLDLSGDALFAETTADTFSSTDASADLWAMTTDTASSTTVSSSSVTAMPLPEADVSVGISLVAVSSTVKLSGWGSHSLF